jgi:hypothetical protein
VVSNPWVFLAVGALLLVVLVPLTSSSDKGGWPIILGLACLALSAIGFLYPVLAPWFRKFF